MEKLKVAIERCIDYADAERAVGSCLDRLGGIKNFVSSGDRVLLKINQLSAKSPDEAVTTHPLFLAAVAKEIRRAGAEPSVGDSPGLHSLEAVAKKSGILDICREHKIPLVELDEPIEVKASGKISKSFRLSARLKEFDAIINLPKLKTHSLTGLTCAVKNLFGCIPGKIKGTYHLRFQDPVLFSEMLLDLHDAVRPALTIVDGIVGMEGSGPAAGSPRNINVVIAGENAVAVDTVAMNVVGMIESEVHTVSCAKRRKISGSDLRDIEVVGNSITEVRVKGFRRPENIMQKMPPSLSRLVRGIFTARPVVVKTKCISCGNCKKICPAGAITMPEKFPRFDYRKCIRCYCCHEICPEKAIPLKRGLIAGLMSRLLRA
jgi:uncharacterized protein (DUF362 family)